MKGDYYKAHLEDADLCHRCLAVYWNHYFVMSQENLHQLVGHFFWLTSYVQKYQLNHKGKEIMVKNNNNKKNYEKERLFYVRDSCNSSDENGTL